MIIIFISAILFTIYGSLITYYRQNWLNCKEYFAENEVNNHVFLSIIIPARNEEKNIGACIQSILAQTYPSHLFEVIVIDDFSEDDTIRAALNSEADNVKVIALKDVIADRGINSYKKKAIEIGISHAKGELIITTDADCIVPLRWLETISSFYNRYNPVFICAPVAFNSKKNFLSIFQSLDFMTLQGITGATVNTQFHSMCNGANLAYEKKAFYDVGGFTGIDTLASGDDMLLMHKISQKFPGRILYLKSPDAIVTTEAMPTIKDFINQRIRWASKTSSYSDKKIIAVLFIVYILNVWMLFLVAKGFFKHSMFSVFFLLMLAKVLIELFFLYPVAFFFKSKNLLWWFLLAEPFHILYTIIAGWLGTFGSYKWKGRKVK